MHWIMLPDASSGFVILLVRKLRAASDTVWGVFSYRSKHYLVGV